MEETGDSGIVKGSTAGGIRASSHEEGGIREVGFGLEEEVGGLARSDQNCIGFKGFNVNGIHINHCKGVVGNAEEELIIECSIDQSQEVCPSRFHL